MRRMGVLFLDVARSTPFGSSYNNYKNLRYGEYDKRDHYKAVGKAHKNEKHLGDSEQKEENQMALKTTACFIDIHPRYEGGPQSCIFVV